MSRFSNKLKEIFSIKSVDKLHLSHAMNMDRALLYRYLNDQSFPDIAFLEELRSELLLTPFEYRELLRAYEMTRLGEEVFENRKIVANIINNIYRQNEKNLGVQSGGPHRVPVLSGETTTVTNTDSVYLALYQVFSDPRTQHVMITMQPDQEFVHRSVFSLLMEQARSKVMHIEHIIRFQSKTRDNPATYNLQIFAKMMPPIYACNYYTDSQYFGYYYYNNQVAVDERAMELYPNIIITSWCVCLMSHNYNSAVVVQNEAVADLYRNNFLSIREKTYCLLKEALTPAGESTLMSRIAKEPYFEAVFKTHPSVSLGGNEEHYTNNFSVTGPEDARRVEGLLNRYRVRTASMDSDLHKGRRDFFTLYGLRDLISTGRFSTAKAANMIPLDHDGIKSFLINYLEKVKSHSRFRAHLVKEDVPGVLSGDFGIYIINGSSMIIEKARHDITLKKYIIEVTERSIVEAFSEYLENGVDYEDYMVSREQTISFLEDLIAVNLNVDCLSPLF